MTLRQSLVLLSLAAVSTPQLRLPEATLPRMVGRLRPAAPVRIRDSGWVESYDVPGMARVARSLYQAEPCRTPTEGPGS